MPTIDVCDVEEQFLELVDAAANGEEFIFTNAGEPIVRLISIQPAKATRTFGQLKGKVHVAADFDDPIDGFG